jgi:hypothetical protein
VLKTVTIHYHRPHVREGIVYDVTEYGKTIINLAQVNLRAGFLGFFAPDKYLDTD